MDETGLAAAQGGQLTGQRRQVLANAGGQRIDLALQVRGAGEVETTQLRRLLIAVAGKGQFDEQAQPLADSTQLMGEVQDAPAALGVTLLVQTGDDLAVEPAQQFLELLAHHLDAGAVLAFAEGSAEHLVGFVAG